MQLARFDPAGFLRDHWQKRPVLIRNPWDAWANPLDPDDLAGLSCDDAMESRIVIRKRKDLKVEHGPFAARRFARLGKKPWTLLVQSVDHVAPAVSALRDPFAFIPNWRIDDVMVSYASDGGGVGAHFDRYDVFLIQGLGQRRWRIGPRCDATTPLRPHDDLRLLAAFTPTDEWVLDPGDMLYLPPGFAHDGVAVGDDCMTYSVGFRAPARSELIAHWCDHLLAGLADDDRYADPGLQTQDNPGEIRADAIDSLYAMMAEAMLDRAAFARWFGTYATTPRRAVADGGPPAGHILRASPASRFSYIQTAATAVTLFVDGEAFDCVGDTAELARCLCAGRPIVATTEAGQALIAALRQQGSVIADPVG